MNIKEQPDPEAELILCPHCQQRLPESILMNGIKIKIQPCRSRAEAIRSKCAAMLKQLNFERDLDQEASSG